MLYDIDVRFLESSEANWKLKRNLARMSDATGIKVFGDSTLFALECIHEPIPNEHGHVYGRMCIRSNNQVLGDFEAPACMLNVTAAHLEEVLRRLPELKTDMFSGQDDITVWERIDKALYLDDDRSIEEVVADANLFSKFDFLTNGGESFDISKSFIIRDADCLQILFIQEGAGLSIMNVHIDLFTDAVTAFLDWINAGGK